MEAIYLGNCTDWWPKEARAKIPKSWSGPIFMADLEDGMFAGNDSCEIPHLHAFFESPPSTRNSPLTRAPTLLNFHS
jgi:hypothetical protein